MYTKNKKNHMDRDIFNKKYKLKNENNFIFKDTDFPSFSKDNLFIEPFIENTNNDTINFKKIVSTNDELNINENMINKLPYGFCKIYYDENRKLVTEMNYDFKDKDYDFNKETNKIIESMEKRWEDYKIYYIELYGYENYEKMYIIPNLKYEYQEEENYEEDSDDYENTEDFYDNNDY